METLSCLWVARTSNDGQSDAIFSFLTYTRPGRKMGRSRATNVIIANAMINTYIPHSKQYFRLLLWCHFTCKNVSNLCFNVNVIIDVLMILVSHKQGGVVLIYHIFFSCLFLTNFCWHQSWTATGKVKSHQFSGVGGLLVHFYWNFIHKMLIFHSQAIVVHMSMY